MENLGLSSCRTGDSAGYDRVWAQIDMDAVLFNMESMRANIREDVKIVAVLKTCMISIKKIWRIDPSGRSRLCRRYR